MIVTKENERLFCRTWTYNAALMLSEFARIVENENGRVKYGHAAIISNYSAEDARREYTEKIQRLEELEKQESKEIRRNALREYKNRLESIGPEREPVRVTHTSYISFVLDGFYYYFELDSNPFFPAHFIKTPIAEDGKRSLDAYLEDSKKEWAFDSFIVGFYASKDDVKEAANILLNELRTAPACKIYRESEKRRVPNYYNNGWHYETVTKPERRAAIDF